MQTKAIHIVILILSMNIVAYGLNKASFIESPGKKLTSNVIDTILVSNKIKCARACKNKPGCTSVNYKSVGNEIECELNSESDDRTADLIEVESSTYLCK